MPTPVWIILILGGAWATWRIVRVVPWAATLRLAALVALLICAVLAAIHLDLNPHNLIAVVVPDFGGTP